MTRLAFQIKLDLYVKLVGGRAIGAGHGAVPNGFLALDNELLDAMIRSKIAALRHTHLNVRGK